MIGGVGFEIRVSSLGILKKLFGMLGVSLLLYVSYGTTVCLYYLFLNASKSRRVQEEMILFCG
jgi:hypothetical protein